MCLASYLWVADTVQIEKRNKNSESFLYLKQGYSSSLTVFSHLGIRSVSVNRLM